MRAQKTLIYIPYGHRKLGRAESGWPRGPQGRSLGGGRHGQ